jgi:hypothetical protein
VKAGEDEEKEDAFEGQEKEGEKGPAEGLRGERALETDLEKKAHEKEIGDGVEGFAEFGGLGMPSDEHPQKEGPEVILEADLLETLGSDHEGEKKPAK